MKDEILETQRLLTNAINYNVMLHAAFTSTEQFVTTTLIVDGKEQEVTVPSYGYIMSLVQKLSLQVSQMQISDDGSDVIQLLSAAGNLQLLYLQKRQQYVHPPKGAKIIKFDTETIPTEYSSSSRTAIFVDLADCKLPPDLKTVVARLDDDNPMYLTVQNHSTAFDKKATILSILDDGTLIVDSNDFEVDDEIQINSAVYKVNYANGNRIGVVLEDLTAPKSYQVTDVIYSLTKQQSSFVEVPIARMHNTLYLSVQYMNLRSAEEAYDISYMAESKHQTLEISLSQILRNTSMKDCLDTLATGFMKIPENISEIQNVAPQVIRVTHRQINSHQYVNSALETLLKTNAILEQAKKDIQRYQEQITTETEFILSQGGIVSESEEIRELKEQLASAQSRYYEAQDQLATLSVSVQSTNPEYVATVYLQPVDAQQYPFVQYIVRYQRLSYNVQDINTQNWDYIYGYPRYVDTNGNRIHPIDDYSQLDYIKIPIHAYEQVAFQVAAVLQYGQPFVTALTGWSDTIFTKLPDELLKEVPLEQMFQNSYAAQLYSNVQQALAAAGVTKHIDVASSWKHKSTDIELMSGQSLYEAWVNLVKRIDSIENYNSESLNIAVYVKYGELLYPVTDLSNISLKAAKSYFNAVIESGTISDNLGSIAEDEFSVLIVNNGTKAVMFNSLFPGSQNALINSLEYDGIPVYIADEPRPQTYGQNHYRSVHNVTNNVDLVSKNFAKFGLALNQFDAIEDNQVAKFKLLNSGSPKSQKNIYLYHSENDTVDVRLATEDYNGIGIHDGFMDLEVLANTETLRKYALDLTEQFPYDFLKSDFVQPAYVSGFSERDNNGLKYLNYYVTRFRPEHKFISGRHTRGAFLFCNEQSIQNLLLPSYGTSNAVSIEPGTTNALEIKFKWQCRMTDRLGLTDTSSIVADGEPTISSQDRNFSYKKAININLQIGTRKLSFDVTFEQSMY